VRRAWLARRAPARTTRPLRFAVACIVPTLVLLSVAATARNVYFAPAMPGFALLLGWWMAETVREHDAWDLGAVRVTAVLIVIAALGFAAALAILGLDAPRTAPPSALAAGGVLGALGVIAAGALAVMADAAARRGRIEPGPYLLALAYCLLLALPAAVIYRVVDGWQDLPAIGRAIGTDAAGRTLILMAPDETTRAFVDMYARTDADPVGAPLDERAIGRLKELIAAHPDALVAAQWPGRETTPMLKRVAHSLGIGLDPVQPSVSKPAWAAAAGLEVTRLYALPNGRRYALLRRAD
jgi:hypothetical protein